MLDQEFGEERARLERLADLFPNQVVSLSSQ
jgi:hypothetical protein